MKKYNQFIYEKKTFGHPERHIPFEFERLIPNPYIRKDIISISNLFIQNGYQIYIVGGAVRDSYLGKSPKDYDLVTNVLPEIAMKLLKPHYKILPIGEAFGINKIITESGDYELATFRKDIGSSDSRRPDSVEYTDIYGDYSRRDLTINSLYYDIKNEEIIDFCDSINDIKNGIIRTVGDPVQRFKEDKLRKMRVVRFSARFGSEIEPETDLSLKKKPDLNGISYERIRDEFIKGIITSKSVIYFMELIEKYNFYKWIFPDLKINKNYVEEKNHIPLISNLLVENSTENIKRILNKLTYTTDEIRDIIFLINFSKINFSNGIKMIQNRNDINIPLLKKLQKNTNLSYDQILKFGEIIGMNDRFVEAFLAFDLTVDGEEVKNKGFKGANIGKEIERIEIENFKKIFL